jgi:micrococcal nuclease
MRATRFDLLSVLCLSLVSCGSVATSGQEVPARTAEIALPGAEQRVGKKLAPSEQVEVVKVVDGDTIHVRRKGAVEKLRLLSVDTEERLANGAQGSATKPATVFGEECALWAQDFFAKLAEPGQPTRVGLYFPRGVEKRDVYGRLLCHVILPDGRDYNRMLVEIGKSPYFNKYGNSECDHEGFVEAQKAAREKRIGIWDPEVNVPKTPGAPSARRPYEKLLPWWELRARAIDQFRERRAADPEHTVDAGDKESLERAARGDSVVHVFGEIDRLFDEKSGDWTLLLRAEEREKAVRVRIPAGARAKFAALGLEGSAHEFQQNFLWFTGRLRGNDRGYELAVDDPSRVRRAGR